MLPKQIIGMLVLVLGLSPSWAQQKQAKETKKDTSAAGEASTTAPLPPHVFDISPADAARKNPRPFTTTSVERGKKIFLTQCALCHGTKGDGKGEMVEEMKISPPDFTKPETLKERTDGALFAIIGTGKPPMPGQAGRMSDTQKWNLVNFLRSLGGKIPEKSTKPEPEENIIEIPQ